MRNGYWLVAALLLARLRFDQGRTARPGDGAAAGAADGRQCHRPRAVMGRTARALEGLFGKPDLDVREGSARKLQFISQICVLDTYLYPPAAGGDPIVTHMDARLPDGRDMDRSSCVAALSRRQEAR